MRVRPGPVGPVSTVHTSTRRDATRRCMFQEVCPGAMVMHSGVVVGPVSSNFAYPAFIRSWPGGFICIRNSPDKNFRSSISLYFSGRETTECVLQLRVKEMESHLGRRKERGRLKKSIPWIRSIIHRRFCQFSKSRQENRSKCLFADLNQLKKWRKHEKTTLALHPKIKKEALFLYVICASIKLTARFVNVNFHKINSF